MGPTKRPVTSSAISRSFPIHSGNISLRSKNECGPPRRFYRPNFWVRTRNRLRTSHSLSPQIHPSSLRTRTGTRAGIKGVIALKLHVNCRPGRVRRHMQIIASTRIFGKKLQTKWDLCSNFARLTFFLRFFPIFYFRGMKYAKIFANYPGKLGVPRDANARFDWAKITRILLWTGLTNIRKCIVIYFYRIERFVGNVFFSWNTNYFHCWCW